MRRTALVLRPEPGNLATATRLTARGVPVRRCPLFRVMPIAWAPPDPADYDSLLLTSANAVRHAGEGLGVMAELPVLAVGAATAAAARAAGLSVAVIGNADAAALVTMARGHGWTRPLHLAGRDRGRLPGVAAIAVYASVPMEVAAMAIDGWRDGVALLHSPRAAERFARLVDGGGLARDRIGVAALSAAVAKAAGSGWSAALVATRPDDKSLVAAACALIDRLGAAADKRV